jgi:hypothetical protein
MTTGLLTRTETGNLSNTNFPVLMKNFTLIQDWKTRKPRQCPHAGRSSLVGIANCYGLDGPILGGATFF